MKKIGPKHIAALIYESTKDAKESELPELMRELVTLMAKHRLLSKANEVISEFYSIYNKENGIEEVTVTSTERASETKLRSLRKALAELLEAKDVFITEKVDQRLGAGVKIETSGGLLIDATLRGRINQLRAKLTR